MLNITSGGALDILRPVQGMLMEKIGISDTRLQVKFGCKAFGRKVLQEKYCYCDEAGRLETYRCSRPGKQGRKS